MVSLIRVREEEIHGTEYFQSAVAYEVHKLNHSLDFAV